MIEYGRDLCFSVRGGKDMANNKMFWILIGFILIMQIPIFLMMH